MAQYSMNAYDADVFIPEFKGLMQYGDQMGGDLRYSPDCLNAETTGGVLQPFPNLKNIVVKYNNENIAFKDNTSIMYLHARNYIVQPSLTSTVYFPGPGGTSIPYYETILPDQEFDTLIIPVGTKLYQIRFPSSYPSGYSESDIAEITAFQISGSYTNTKWHWCTYEHIFPEPGAEDPPGTLGGKANILILSNESDGTYYFEGNSLTKINSTPAKFGYVARYAERIWGCGVGANRDSIYYSRPFSATDWTQNNSSPADGGGEIREATFDNDKLVALVPFGDALIAFSELRAWRITGTDPSNFSIQEQYGNGTRYPQSIAVIGEHIIMLGEHGLVSYDGYRVTPFMKEATYELFRQINKNGKGEPVAITHKGRYILALSNEIFYTTSPNVFHSEGFKFLIYDSMDGTITLADAPLISGMCNEPPLSWAVTAISGVSTQKIGIMQIRFDSWDLKDITSKAVRWVSPWVTFGRTDIQKGGFELYFTPEVAEEATAGVTLKFTIQTEKKSKSKSYTVQPLTATEIAAGKEHKMKRLHFGGSGRRFRLIIEVAAGNTIPWRLIGGIHIIAETDKD